ncbi:hypothetical protein GYMLUDRAFT_839919, partial [Collybiopsis luxurians FD-317 M1]
MTPHWYLSILPFWKREIAGAQQGQNMGMIVKIQTEKQNLGSWNTGSEVYGLDISKDGTKIVSGGEDTTARIWNARSRTPIGEPLQGHTDWVGSVAFSPDGKRIVSGSVTRQSGSGMQRLELPLGSLFKATLIQCTQWHFLQMERELYL